MQSIAKKPSSILRKESIMSYEGLSPLEISVLHQPYHLAKADLQKLNSRFSDLCSQIEEDQKPSNEKLFFNFITCTSQKQQQTLKFDPQVVSSRLKQVENKVQMSRANMELDKRHSPKKRQAKKSPVNYSPDYLQFYSKGKHMLPAFDQIPQPHDQSNDEQEELVKQEADPAILHYSELKRRKKFLGYLKKIVHSPPKPSCQTDRTLPLQNPIEYERALAKLERNRVGPNPEQIIERQYPKFFNRVNNFNLSQEIKDKPVCKKLISLHEHFIDGSPDISDENKRKLQQKLNHIVKQIAKTDRHDPNRKPTIKLPRLSNIEN